jgi:hypothetical protein
MGWFCVGVCGCAERVVIHQAKQRRNGIGCGPIFSPKPSSVCVLSDLFVQL